MKKDEQLVKAPVFSVVMPAYNAEATVGESIGSVLAQTMTDWELLVVDDCSTDGTLEVCRSFSDPRIRALQTPRNVNAAGARNTALEQARGEYVAFLDSDDLAAPNRLERQLRFFRENPSVSVCGTYVETFTTGPLAKTCEPICYPVADGPIKSSMFFYDPFVTSSVSVRAGALREAGRPVFSEEYAPSEDYDLWARLIEKVRFANLPEYLNRYRLHGKQLTQMQSAPMQKQVSRIWGDLLRKVGIDADDGEIALHREIVCNEQHEFGSLGRIREWLERVWKAGRGQEFLVPSAWDTTFGFRWYVACQRCERQTLKTWQAYRQSPLAARFRSRRRKLQLLRSCLIGSWRALRAS